MKHLLLGIIIICSFILLISCDNDKCKCFKSSGEFSEITINTEAYNKIETHSNFNITLCPDTNAYVKVSGGKNLIGFVECKVENGILSISDNNKCAWLRKYEPINIEIGMNKVEKITFWESANINCSDTLRFNWFAFENHTKYSTIHLLINCDRLEFWSHAATGDYFIEGKANIAFLYNRGTGYLHAENFLVKQADITHMSTGNSTINVSDSLHIINIIHGDVYLKNCPIITYDNTNSLSRLISDCK